MNTRWFALYAVGKKKTIGNSFSYILLGCCCFCFVLSPLLSTQGFLSSWTFHNKKKIPIKKNTHSFTHLLIRSLAHNRTKETNIEIKFSFSLKRPNFSLARRITSGSFFFLLFFFFSILFFYHVTKKICIGFFFMRPKRFLWFVFLDFPHYLPLLFSSSNRIFYYYYDDYHTKVIGSRKKKYFSR